VNKLIMSCCIVLLTGCGGYLPVSGIHGLTDVVFFSDPDNDQVRLAGTLYDVYPEKYQPSGSTRSISEGVPWAYNNDHIATGSEFGTGKQNTLDIIQNQGGDPQDIMPNVTDPVPYAAWLCEQLAVDGTGDQDYTDWFLPSIRELKAMHKAMFDSVPRDNMDDMNEYWRGMYWSSTEANDPIAAQYLNFWDANPGAGEFLKHSYAKVRCVHELESGS